MPTANEAILATDCADLQRQLDAERTCNRNHLARIARLNALTVTQQAKIDRLTSDLARAAAELADHQAGNLDASQLGY